MRRNNLYTQFTVKQFCFSFYTEEPHKNGKLFFVSFCWTSDWLCAWVIEANCWKSLSHFACCTFEYVKTKISILWLLLNSVLRDRFRELWDLFISGGTASITHARWANCCKVQILIQTGANVVYLIAAKNLQNGEYKPSTTQKRS